MFHSSNTLTIDYNPGSPLVSLSVSQSEEVTYRDAAHLEPGG